MRRVIGMLLAAITAAASLGIAMTVPLPDPESGTGSESIELTRMGMLHPAPAIAIADLPIEADRWLVRYSFEARLDSIAAPDSVVCGMVDQDGRPRSFTRDQDPVFAGDGWQSRTAEASFNLPDMTLGLRCDLVGTGLGSVAFREVELSATRLASAGR